MTELVGWLPNLVQWKGQRRIQDRRALWVKVWELTFICKGFVHIICIIKDTFHLPARLCCCKSLLLWLGCDAQWGSRALSRLGAETTQRINPTIYLSQQCCGLGNVDVIILQKQKRRQLMALVSKASAIKWSPQKDMSRANLQNLWMWLNLEKGSLPMWSIQDNQDEEISETIWRGLKSNDKCPS